MSRVLVVLVGAVLVPLVLVLTGLGLYAILQLVL